MKKIALFHVLFIALVMIAFAADWVLVYSDNDTEEYVDMESIRVEGELVYYQKKSVLVNENHGYKKIYGAKAFATFTHNVDNCQNKTTKVLKITLKDTNGKNLMSAATPSEVDPMPVFDEGSSQQIHQFACKQLPPKSRLLQPSHYLAITGQSG